MRHEVTVRDEFENEHTIYIVDLGGNSGDDIYFEAEWLDGTPVTNDELIQYVCDYEYDLLVELWYEWQEELQQAAFDAEIDRQIDLARGK
jgi:hypothetical protein